jgi:RNA polymerase sigma-70 factor (ECF subfamily)
MEGVEERNVREETLVTNIIRHKRVIEGMITALIGDASTAEDLFQEVAVIMTRKREEVDEDCRFVAWGRTIAANVVRDYRKSRARRRVQFLDDASLEVVAAEFEKDDAGWEERCHALRRCTETLPARDRQILQRRYHEEESAEEVAASLSMSRGALDTMLYRIRKALQLCVEGRLRQSEAP